MTNRYLYHKTFIQYRWLCVSHIIFLLVWRLTVQVNIDIEYIQIYMYFDGLGTREREHCKMFVQVP